MDDSGEVGSTTDDLDGEVCTHKDSRRAAACYTAGMCRIEELVWHHKAALCQCAWRSRRVSGIQYGSEGAEGGSSEGTFG